MSIKSHSQLAKIIEILAVLNPTNPHDPVDANIIASFDDDLTPDQVSPYLSILRYTDFLARVGTLNRYALYIRTLKPLPTITASIQRGYKRRLDRRFAKNYTSSPRKIAREVSKTVIAARRQELRPRGLSSRRLESSRQLTLFGIG
jgi:hypothetical protein